VGQIQFSGVADTPNDQRARARFGLLVELEGQLILTQLRGMARVEANANAFHRLG
jgi:hypothetical protein